MRDEASNRFTALTSSERTELLRLARAAVGSRLRLNAEPILQLSTPALHAAGGAFVTLHALGKLRGCVGRALAEESLYLTVTHMARAAAFEDPRFPPLTTAEWPALSIEVSRLTAPVLVTPEEVVPGRHGLYIQRGLARGLLLPQVARRCGWSREEFLRQTCCKAGLPPAAWCDPATKVYVFEAEIFAEPGGEPPPV